MAFIAIHAKPCTVLRRLAVQKRTVFGGAPCTEPCVYRYTYATSAHLYVKRKIIGCALAHRLPHIASVIRCPLPCEAGEGRAFPTERGSLWVTESRP